jgi:hypothetical protein
LVVPIGGTLSVLVAAQYPRDFGMIPSMAAETQRPAAVARADVVPAALTAVQEFRQPCFFPGNREIFKKNREAIEHERAITERD